MSGSRKISELTSATDLTGNELIVLVQDGETRQASVDKLNVFQLVRSVNGLEGDVLLGATDVEGLEEIVAQGGVTPAIASVSARVDTVQDAVTSVQTYLLAEISVLAASGGGGVPEAPLDGIQYARQSGFWTPVGTGGGGGSAPLLSLSISDEGTDIVPGVVGYAHWPFADGEIANIALGLSVGPSGGPLTISVAYFNGAFWETVEPNKLPATFAAGADFWGSLSTGPGLDDDPLPTIPFGAKLQFTASGSGTGARALKAYITPVVNV